MAGRARIGSFGAQPSSELVSTIAQPRMFRSATRLILMFAQGQCRDLTSAGAERHPNEFSRWDITKANIVPYTSNACSEPDRLSWRDEVWSLSQCLNQPFQSINQSYMRWPHPNDRHAYHKSSLKRARPSPWLANLRATFPSSMPGSEKLATRFSVRYHPSDRSTYQPIRDSQPISTG